jgi:hypothetical protein
MGFRSPRDGLQGRLRAGDDEMLGSSRRGTGTTLRLHGALSRLMGAVSAGDESGTGAAGTTAPTSQDGPSWGAREAQLHTRAEDALQIRQRLEIHRSVIDAVENLPFFLAH